MGRRRIGRGRRGIDPPPPTIDANKTDVGVETVSVWKVVSARFGCLDRRSYAAAPAGTLRCS
jgi:hypothetical protein